MTTRFLAFIFSLFLLGNATGCALLSSSSTSESNLKNAIETLWQAKKETKWDVVYDMTIKAYQEKKTKNSFIKGSNIIITDFSLKDVQIDDSGSTAKAVIDYSANMMGFKFTMQSKEEWLLEEGQWRLNLLPSLGFPFMNNNGKK